MIRASLAVTFFALLGSALSFAGQIAIAHAFGAAAELDGYLVAISLPSTIAALGVGVLGFQIVPALQGEERRKNFDAALKGMLYGLGGLALIVGIAGVLNLPWLAPLLSIQLTAGTAPAVRGLALIAWGWLPLAILGGVLTGALHVQKKFLVATLAQCLPAVGALLGCLLGARSLGVQALAWGQLGGYLCMVGLLYGALDRTAGPADWGPMRKMVRHAPLALAALLVFVAYPAIDAFCGPKAGQAGVSLLGYSQRLIVGFASLAVVGATTVLFPRLAGQAASGDHAALNVDLSRGLRTLLACVAPATGVLMVLSEPVVRLLFFRGAFGEAEAVALAGLLRWMFGGMIAMCCMSLAFRALFAQGRVAYAAGLSATGTILYALLSVLLVKRWGLQGIGAAYAVAWWAVLVVVMKSLGDRSHRKAGFVVRLAVVSGCCALAAWLAALPFASAGGAGRVAFWRLMAGGVAAAGVFGVASLAWPGLDEIRAIRKSLSQAP